MTLPISHTAPAVLVVALSAPHDELLLHELVVCLHFFNIPRLAVWTLPDIGLAAHVTVFAFPSFLLCDGFPLKLLELLDQHELPCSQ